MRNNILDVGFSDHLTRYYLLKVPNGTRYKWDIWPNKEGSYGVSHTPLQLPDHVAHRSAALAALCRRQRPPHRPFLTRLTSNSRNTHSIRPLRCFNHLSPRHFRCLLYIRDQTITLDYPMERGDEG